MRLRNQVLIALNAIAVLSGSTGMAPLKPKVKHTGPTCSQYAEPSSKLPKVKSHRQERTMSKIQFFSGKSPPIWRAQRRGVKWYPLGIARF
jgi:hypothetical protein